METAKIYGAINSAMSGIGAISKNKKSQQNYLYRGIDAVYSALQPLLIENKIFIVPEVLEQTREERVTKNGTGMMYSILKVRYTFYAEDGSNVSATVTGEGMDSGDKASNKAMSIAFKYACFQIFCIPTEEVKDPDGETPPEAQKKSLVTSRSNLIKNISRYASMCGRTYDEALAGTWEKLRLSASETIDTISEERALEINLKVLDWIKITEGRHA